ncbi:MAG: P-loop NTPase [Candidatus Thiodiazotropha sp.]
MKRLLILNSKGGCGKTTIATNLAGYYAASGTPTALLDYDPQGSSKRWLELRSEKLSNIHGVFAAKTVQGAVTRSFAQRVPGETKRIVVDTPASMKRMEMMDMLRSASAVIVPVLPSAIDRHVTVDFLRELTTLCRQMGIKIPVGIVANRVRINSRAFKQLKQTFEEFDIPMVAILRDTQNYVQAAESGCAVVEMDNAALKKDQQQWGALIHWLETGQIPLQISPPPHKNQTSLSFS